jgi:hypothetical protein
MNTEISPFALCEGLQVQTGTASNRLMLQEGDYLVHLIENSRCAAGLRHSWIHALHPLLGIEILVCFSLPGPFSSRPSPSGIWG